VQTLQSGSSQQIVRAALGTSTSFIMLGADEVKRAAREVLPDVDLWYGLLQQLNVSEFSAV
jgi:hypothetical protein